MSDNTITLPDRMLTFGLGGEFFAIDAQCVREILEVPPITRVPGAPAFADGLVNVRGAIVPLADLAVVFGMALTAHAEDTRVIVIEAEIEGEPTTIGILADKVLDVATMDGGRFIILPDLARIFTDCVDQIHRNGAALLPS